MDSKMKKLALLPVALLAVCSAHAFTFTGVGLGKSVTLSGAYNGSVFAGQLHFSDAKFGNLTTYCVDLFNQIRTGMTYPVVLKDSTTAESGYKRAGNIVAAAAGQAKSADAAAGLQLAVWKTLYDGGSTNWSTGKVRVQASGSVMNYANKFLCYSSQLGKANFYQTTTCVGQSQMGAVPEPGSMIAMGMAALACYRRKKKSI